MAEHAVIVHLRLSDETFGSSEEREAIFAIEDLMSDAIERSTAGEFDGHEFGEGECVLFMYGPEADRLFASIEPILKSSPLAAGGYAIKRYGDASDPGSRKVRVTW